MGILAGVDEPIRELRGLTWEFASLIIMSNDESIFFCGRKYFI